MGYDLLNISYTCCHILGAFLHFTLHWNQIIDVNQTPIYIIGKRNTVSRKHICMKCTRYAMLYCGILESGPMLHAVVFYCPSHAGKIYVRTLHFKIGVRTADVINGCIVPHCNINKIYIYYYFNKHYNKYSVKYIILYFHTCSSVLGPRNLGNRS
jgi:hypothetical protein